ncbi:MAG: amidohydrolase family protein [Rhodocyclaceae bacterium]
MELTLRHVRLAEAPDALVDVGVQDGRIVAIAQNLAPGARDIDAEGRLLVPGFVETHIHLDKACILDRCQMHRGDLAEAIDQVAQAKRAFSEEDVAARAAATLRRAVLQGTTRMRTHVEVDPGIGLRGYHGVKRALAQYAWALDAEICVFPQEGLLNNPGTEELMVAALRDGARVVGAAPYVDSDPHGQIDRVFALAREYDVDIDMHLDFSSDAGALDADYVCRKADEYGWGGRVAIGHVTKLAFLDPAGLAATARRLADAGIAVTVLPATDLYLMCRDHDHAVPRGVAPAHTLLAEGVNCSLSTNNVLNPFTPFGDASLLRMANLFANLAQIGRRAGMRDCLDMVTQRSARLLNCADYGIAVGKPADFVLVDNPDPAMAVAEISPVLYGFKRGRPTFTRPCPTLHVPQ